MAVCTKCKTRSRGAKWTFNTPGYPTLCPGCAQSTPDTADLESAQAAIRQAIYHGGGDFTSGLHIPLDASWND